MTADDRQFLMTAAEGDVAEVQMGQLAQQKGKSSAVKSFGQMLQQDHGAHLEKVRAMAGSASSSLPKEPNAEHKALHTKLSGLSGDQFDQAFLQAMVAEHQKDIAKYEAQAQKSGPLSQLASETVPALQAHLKTAQAAMKNNKG